MGRRARRFRTRVCGLAAAALVAATAYTRWQWQHTALVPLSSLPSYVHTYTSSDNTTTTTTTTTMTTRACDDAVALQPPPRPSREQHWQQLQRSGASATAAYDVLVIGGGVTGLYCAVDAAARGLRVAVVDAADWGGGGHSAHAPPVTAGVFAYVQRAWRQREWAWLRRAYATLRCDMTWRRVAPHCGVVHASSSAALPVVNNNDNSSSRSDSDDAAASVPYVRSLIVTDSVLEAAEATMVVWLSRALALLPLGVVASWQTARRVTSRDVNAALPPDSSSGSSADDMSVVLRPRRRATVVRDVVLDATAATLTLARTAELLGVTLVSYAAVRSLSYGRDERDGRAVVHACVRDTSIDNDNDDDADNNNKDTAARVAHVCARGVINCAGNHVDVVKAMLTCDDSSNGGGASVASTTRAFARYVASTYLVVPRDAVVVAAPAHDDNNNSNSNSNSNNNSNNDEKSARHGATMVPLMTRLPRAANALELRNVAYGQTVAMVLPWHDDCVLVGPVHTSLPSPQQQLATHAPRSATNIASSSSNSSNNSSSDDNGNVTAAVPSMRDASCAVTAATMAATPQQRLAVLRALRACGVYVQPHRVLSCLTDVVPVLAPPSHVSWASALYHDGYAVTSSHDDDDNNDKDTASAATTTARRASRTLLPLWLTARDAAAASMTAQRDDTARAQACVVHVYGGAPLRARDVAEAAVDKLLRHTRGWRYDDDDKTSNSNNNSNNDDDKDSETRVLRRCCTRTLTLYTPPRAAVSTIAPATTMLSSRAHVEQLVRDTYVVRLSDVLLRRSHVGYTSPDEALRAVPSLARVVARVRGWSAARTAREVADAQACLSRVAVAHTTA